PHALPISLLRFVENPRDRVAGFRLMHLIPGMGPSSAQRVLDHMAEGADPIAVLVRVPAPPRAREDWKAFIGTNERFPVFASTGRGGHAYKHCDWIRALSHVVEHPLRRGGTHPWDQVHQPEAGNTVSRILDEA